jgi:hypothetical protein
LVLLPNNMAPPLRLLLLLLDDPIMLGWIG